MSVIGYMFDACKLLSSTRVKVCACASSWIDDCVVDLFGRIQSKLTSTVYCVCFGHNYDDHMYVTRRDILLMYTSRSILFCLMHEN